MKTARYIVLTLKFHKEGRRWIAYCEELGTATFGRSLREAKEKLKEAVTLHLNTLEDVGEIERFFKENNIKFYSYKPKTITFTVTKPSDRIFMQASIQRIHRQLTPT